MPGVRRTHQRTGQPARCLVAPTEGPLPELPRRTFRRAYPLVELTCAGLFAGTAARFGCSWDLPAYLVLFAGLLALSCVDVEMMLLPRKIVYPLTAMVGLLLVMAAGATGLWRALLVAALSALGWFAVFFTINLINDRFLGFGDVRLAPVLGLSLGWLGVGYVFLGFFAANVFGAIIGVALISIKRRSRQARIPYGVFLSLGCAAGGVRRPRTASTLDQLPHLTTEARSSRSLLTDS